MLHRDGRFTGPGQRSIYYQYWLPDGETRAVMLLVHGAGEHSGRYAGLAESCCARGYAVAALDHIGHGRSEGKPGHVDRFQDFLDTLEILRQQVACDFPGKPLLLIGHSLGGLICTAYLLENPDGFQGCVLSGPAIMTDLEPGPLQIMLIRFFSLLLPQMGAMQLDASGVSRDEKVVEAYRRDPLVNHGKLSSRLVSELFASMLEVQARCAEIHLPLMLMHGEADCMTSPAGSRLLYERAGSADKTLKLYPGLYHEIFNEPEKQAVIADLIGWCDQRLANA